MAAPVGRSSRLVKTPSGADIKIGLEDESGERKPVEIDVADPTVEVEADADADADADDREWRPLVTMSYDLSVSEILFRINQRPTSFIKMLNRLSFNATVEYRDSVMSSPS